MDPRFQASFIPKKPIAMTVRSKRGPINLLALIATVVFIVVMAAAIGSFFYQSYLNSRISSDQQSLNLTQGEFDPSTINQIIRLDSRLTNASLLLSAHTQLSNIFSALESTTIQTVRFTDFTFAVGDQNTLSLTMKGEAVGFSDVALQSEAFNRTSYFKNLVVSDLSLETSGAVSFTMTMTIDPSLIAYAPASSVGSISSSVPAISSTSTSASASSTLATTSISTTSP